MHRRGTVLLLSTLIFAGCAERVRVVSIPPGARVFLDGREAGTTPYTFTLQEDQLRDIPYRVELEPYRPVEGVLRKGVAPGRVVGAVFTLGILYAFRSPYYVQNAKVYLALQPTEASGPPLIEDRLRKLKELRDDGVLSESEYEEQRTRILQEHK